MTLAAEPKTKHTTHLENLNYMLLLLLNMNHCHLITSNLILSKVIIPWVSITGLAGYQLCILFSLHWACHSSSYNCLLRGYVQDLRNPLQPTVGWSFLLVVGLLMPERLKGRDQTIRVLPRCSRLGVGLRADSPLP